jgi:hypothetical protein
MISSTETHLEMGNWGSLFDGALHPFPSLCVFSNVLVSAELYVLLRCRERERGDDELLSRELANVLIFLLEEREVCFQSDDRVFCIAEETMC